MRGNKMTKLQRRLVEEYVIDLNGAQAAKRAGYARRPGGLARLLRRPDIAAAIAEAIETRAVRARLSADRVLQEYARIAFADIRRIADFGSGELKVRQGAELSDDDAAAIAEVTPAGRNGGVRVKLHDKKAALDAIARHLGLFGPPGIRQHPPGTPPPKDETLAAQDARAILSERLARLAANGSGGGNGSNGGGA